MNNLTTLQEKTLKVVKEASRARPVTAKRLAFIINLKENPGKEGANTRSIIHALRVKGYPICANVKGYYYAQTSTELSEYIVSLGARIMKVEEAVKGLQKSFDKVRNVRCANQEQITRLF